MRKSKFAEEKITAVLTEQERGTGTAEVCRDQPCNLPQMEGEVRRDGCFRGAQAEAA
jgi:hypothetical protein